jgi:RNA polymerase sigma-70 factor (ECF subfamily)
MHFDDPGWAAEQREGLQRIFACLHQLPDHQKTALILNKIERMSQQEVAAIMDTSPKAVESLVQRAKVRLAHLLAASEGNMPQKRPKP